MCLTPFAWFLFESDPELGGRDFPTPRLVVVAATSRATTVTDSSSPRHDAGAVDIIVRDLRTGWRALRAAKGFAVTVVATLALGIGAAATIFSVVDHVLIRSLAYPDADRLVSLYQRGKDGTSLRLVSNPTLRDWAEAHQALSGIAWIRGDGLMVTRPDGARPGVRRGKSHLAAHLRAPRRCTGAAPRCDSCRP